MTRLACLCLLSLACAPDPIYPPRAEIWADLLARLDSNADGQLDAAEFAALQDPHPTGLGFAAFDTNGDGGIDPAELDAVISSHEPRPLVDSHMPQAVRKSLHRPGQAERQGLVP